MKKCVRFDAQPSCHISVTNAVYSHVGDDVRWERSGLFEQVISCQTWSAYTVMLHLEGRLRYIWNGGASPAQIFLSNLKY